MLRVTDRLEEGLIMDIMKWDEVNKCYLRKFSHYVIIFSLYLFIFSLL